MPSDQQTNESFRPENSNDDRPLKSERRPHPAYDTAFAVAFWSLAPTFILALIFSLSTWVFNIIPLFFYGPLFFVVLVAVNWLLYRTLHGAFHITREGHVRMLLVLADILMIAIVLKIFVFGP